MCVTLKEHKNLFYEMIINAGLNIDSFKDEKFVGGHNNDLYLQEGLVINLNNSDLNCRFYYAGGSFDAFY